MAPDEYALPDSDCKLEYGANAVAEETGCVASGASGAMVEAGDSTSVTEGFGFVVSSARNAEIIVKAIASVAIHRAANLIVAP